MLAYTKNRFDVERDVVTHDYRPEVFYKFFSKKNINYISFEVTKRLEGVHPDGKHIIVSENNIISVMDSIYNNTFRDVDKMTMMVICFIVDTIRDEYEIEKQNNNLNIWVTNFLPQYNIQQTPKIKLRERRVPPMLFNMNY